MLTSHLIIMQNLTFDRSHKHTRCMVERAIGQWKRRFHCLHAELRLSPPRACSVIAATAVLHNIAKRRNIALPDQEAVDHHDGDQIEPVQAHAAQNFAMRNHIVQTYFA